MIYCKYYNRNQLANMMHERCGSKQGDIITILDAVVAGRQVTTNLLLWLLG